MKLALGTVQFGIDYGAFNAQGKTPLDEVRAILARAKAAGIATLDTARAYGEAEAVLAATKAPGDFDIITKCPALDDDDSAAAATVAAAFETSCTALGVERVHGYLLHNSRDLARPGVWVVLERLMAAGRVARVGISGYDVTEVAALVEQFPITLTQLPANVLDPWFLSSPLPDRVEVHVRSAFLQGFLLRDPNALPDHFAPFRETLHDFRAQAAAHELTPLQAALAPLLSSPNIAQVVVGVETLAQLDDILAAATVAAARPDVRFAPFPSATPDLTDPRRWK